MASTFLAQDDAGAKLLHRDYPAEPQRFLLASQPFRENLVVGCECTFSWYWLADLCLEQQIPFVLGHALYMKAIHGGKKKNDKIDSDKIVTLLRGGMFPVPYVYTAGMRETHDLLWRRGHRAESVRRGASHDRLPRGGRVVRATGHRPPVFI